MIEVIIASHGGYAKEVVKTSEMFAGEQDNVQALGLKLGADLDEFKKEVEDALKEAQSRSGKIIVLTDIMFGTPFNTFTNLMDDYDFQHFTGVNIPIYLEVITSRTFCTLDKICENIKELGSSSFVHVNKILKEK